MGPHTVPAVQQWMDDGVPAWVLPSRPRVVVQEQDVPLLGQLAAQLAGELGVSGDLGAVHIPSLDGGRGGGCARGDILLEICAFDGVQLTPEQHAESYRITAGEVLTITAPAPAGTYYGTRTLLQLLRRGGAVTGTTTDWPAFAQRGVMVDVGRKHFTPAWLKRLIADMGWLKLNLLHLHLNDNSGVGLECTSHPEIVSERHLSYSDLEEILAVAATHQVTVVPEFDTPSHAASIVSQRPVVLEWADHFPGPYFHLGGDEFFAAPWEPEEHRDPLRFPGLAAWAAQETGSIPALAASGLTAPSTSTCGSAGMPANQALARCTTRAIAWSIETATICISCCRLRICPRGPAGSRHKGCTNYGTHTVSWARPVRWMTIWIRPFQLPAQSCPSGAMTPRP